MKPGERAKLWIPRRLLPLARSSYEFLRTSQYYPHYLFLAGRAGRPARASLEITYRCNLKCAMCPLAVSFGDPASRLVREWEEKEELRTDEVRRIVEELAALRVKTLTVTGGEPFLRDDLLDIVAHTKEQGLRCTVLSNGTLIDRARAAAFCDIGLDVLYLSLDGPAEVNNRIRNSGTAFAKTVEAAQIVKEEKQRAGSSLPVVTFSCTISALNAEHLVPLIDTSREHDASLDLGYMFYTTENMLQRTDELLPHGSVKAEDQNLPDELRDVDAEQLWNEICRARVRADELGVRLNFQPDLKREELDRWFTDDQYFFVKKCFYPWYAVRVNPYGAVYPCSLNLEMGNVRDDSLKSIWNGEEYVRFRKGLRTQRLLPRCAKCCKLCNRLWDWL